MSNVKRLVAATLIIAMCAFAGTSAQGKDGKIEKSEDGSELVLRGQVEDVPLQELIQLYADDTGRTVMMDPKRISGTVSMVAPRGGSKFAAKDVLHSALAEFRLVLVSDGAFDKIIPAAEAVTMCDTVTKDDLDSRSPAEFVRIVVMLKNAEANAVRGALQNLTTRQGGVVNPVKGVNGLVICDNAENMRSLLQLVDVLDAPGEE